MGDLNDHFHSNRKEEKNEQFKDRRHGHKCATGSHNNRGTSVPCISTSDRTCGVDLMRWYSGKPRKDGTYYLAYTSVDLLDVSKPLDKEIMNITTATFTVEGGWGSRYGVDGNLKYKDEWTPPEGHVWADILPPFKAKYLEWHERLQDILDEVDEFRKEDPARDDRDYESESECDYYNNLDELSDLLDQAIGFAREVA